MAIEEVGSDSADDERSRLSAALASGRQDRGLGWGTGAARAWSQTSRHRLHLGDLTALAWWALLGAVFAVRHFAWTPRSADA